MANSNRYINKMKLHFISTIEDNADCDFRKIKQAKNYNKDKLFGLLFQGSTIFLVLQYLDLNLAFAIISVFIIYYLTTYDYYIKENLKSHYKSIIPPQGVDAEYEITESKLVYRKQGIETHLNWEKLESIKENPSDFEVHFQKGITAVYHYTIFSSEEQRESWLKAIKEKSNKM